MPNSIRWFNWLVKSLANMYIFCFFILQRIPVKTPLIKDINYAAWIFLMLYPKTRSSNYCALTHNYMSVLLEIHQMVDESINQKICVFRLEIDLQSNAI